MPTPVVTVIGGFSGPWEFANPFIDIVTSGSVPEGDTIIIVSAGSQAVGVTYEDSSENFYFSSPGLTFCENAIALPSGSTIRVGVSNSPFAGSALVRVYAVSNLETEITFDAGGWSALFAGLSVTTDWALLAYEGEDVWGFGVAHWSSSTGVQPHGDTFAVTEGGWTDIDNKLDTNTGIVTLPFGQMQDFAIATSQKYLPEHDGSSLHYKGVITPPPSNSRSGGFFGLIFTVRPEPSLSGIGVSHDRHLLTGQLMVATTLESEGGAFNVKLVHSDAAGGLENIITVDANADCTDPNISFSPDGQLHTLYRRDTTILYRVSENNGNTWSVPTTIAINYNMVVFDWGKSLLDTPQMVVMLYREDVERWFVTVGAYNASNALIFSTPADIGVDAKNKAGCVRQRLDGVWEFSYVNTSDEDVITRCENLSDTGAGTWS